MNTIPTESEDQMKLVDYLSILERQKKVLWFCGSGNGQFQKSIAVKMKMKREGIRAGMPDIMIVFPKNIIFIELKRKKGGKITPEQENTIAMINRASDASGGMFPAFISYGFDEAKAIVDRYI